MLSKMIWHDVVVPKTTEEIDFRGKGLDAGQGLPTQTFLNSKLVTPDNFIQFRQSIEKLFMFFSYTDGPTDGHTNSM